MLPNEVLHLITDLVGVRLDDVTGDTIYCSFNKHAIDDAEHGLNYVMRYVNKCDFVPIPYVGPTKLVFSFVRPTFWSTCDGITSMSLFYHDGPKIMHITVYVLHLDLMTRKQLSWILPHITHIPSPLFGYDRSYDNMYHLRNIIGYRIRMFSGAYCPATGMYSSSYSATTGIYPVTENRFVRINGTVRRAKQRISMHMYRTHCGRWMEIHEFKLSDTSDKPIGSFCFLATPFVVPPNDLRVVGYLPVDHLACLWVLSHSPEYAILHDATFHSSKLNKQPFYAAQITERIIEAAVLTGS